MIWLLLKRLVGQFPKWALVVTVLVVSTGLFGFWWFTRGGKRAAAGPSAAVEDISPKLNLIESKWQRLLLVDNDLYDIDSGKPVFRHWLKDGMPLRLFYDPATKKMIAQYERGFVRYGLDGREEAVLTQRSTPAFTPGLKSVVFAKDKEVWRADVDWQAFKFANERKVTSIEQFNELNFAANIILLTDKTLVVRNFTTLLRVDLDGGSVKPMRIPLGDIGKRRSPDSKWVVGTQSGQFYCYDVDADEAKTIPIGRLVMNDFQWLGNERGAALMAGKAVFAYDRTTNNLTEVAQLPFSCFKMGDPSPGGRFIFCAGGIDGRNGALVDLEKKTAVQIQGGAGIAWVNGNTFAFSREVPSSDLRGTWLQTAGKTERRVSLVPYQVSNSGAQFLALPSTSLVIFETRHGLTKMDLDGSELAELVNLRQPVARVLGIQGWRKE
jgi:hypothetical protein